jgi:type I restriction enzyme, R subunit
LNTASEGGYDPKFMPDGLSERDICTKFITPAMERAGWDVQVQVREEVGLTAGRVIVRGKLVARQDQGGRLRSLLQARSTARGHRGEGPELFGRRGMQQALEYAEMLGVPFALSSNGSGFLLHGRAPS